jgi:glycosyltransferase involved in cell wall biosynthesis
MKILLLTQRFPPALGGVETHVRHLAEGLTQHGDDIEVLTTDLRTDSPLERLPEEDGEFPYPVHRVRAIKAAVLPHALGNVSPSMIGHVLSGHWDVVHGHAYGFFPTFAASLGGLLDRSALVLTPHSDPGRPSLEKRAFDRVVPLVTLRQAHRVIALTELEAGHLERLGVARGRIAVIPNGVDMAEFAWGPNRVRDGDGTSVLFAGRCYPDQKGLEVLMHAVSQLPREMAVHLRIVGEDWGGYAVVRDLARRLGIEDRVTLVGMLERSQLLDEFRRADVFVLPSLFDSFPIAILEAMAAGLPVIATRVGGVPEVVLDGETGLLVEPGDPKRLASAIEALASDEGARREMGKRGRARAQLFSWDEVIARTRRVYAEAVNGRAA